MDNEDNLTYEKLIEKFNNLPKIIPEDNLLGIVITKLAPEINFGKCQIETGFYLLCRREFWNSSVKRMIEESITDSYMAYSRGITVYDSDEMGAKVIIESEKYRKDEHEKYTEYLKRLCSISGVPKYYINGV